MTTGITHSRWYKACFDRPLGRQSIRDFLYIVLAVGAMFGLIGVCALVAMTN